MSSMESFDNAVLLNISTRFHCMRGRAPQQLLIKSLGKYFCILVQNQNYVDFLGKARFLGPGTLWQIASMKSQVLTATNRLHWADRSPVQVKASQPSWMFQNKSPPWMMQETSPRNLLLLLRPVILVSCLVNPWRRCIPNQQRRQLWPSRHSRSVIQLHIFSLAISWWGGPGTNWSKRITGHRWWKHRNMFCSPHICH